MRFCWHFIQRGPSAFSVAIAEMPEGSSQVLRRSCFSCCSWFRFFVSSSAVSDSLSRSVHLLGHCICRCFFHSRCTLRFCPRTISSVTSFRLTPCRPETSHIFLWRCLL